MQLEVEIYPLSISGDEVNYSREVIELRGAVDPDEVAIITAGNWGYDESTDIIHSTSWHFDDPKVVVTYIAYIQNPTLKFRHKVLLRDLVVAGGDANRPRPARLNEGAIVAHAIRHLAFLARDPQLQERMKAADVKSLNQVSAILAGEVN